MSNVGRQVRNVVILLFIACLGILAGFVSGVYWAVNNVANVANYQSANIAATAKKTLEKQNQQLQTAYQQIAMLSEQLKNLSESASSTPQKVYVPIQQIQPTSPPQSYFTGEDLMQAVNKYRREHGVPELQLQSDLCQLASRRLGELINLGDLDNHAGFEAYFNDHSVSDLGNLSNVAENLASGYNNAQEVVNGWDSSPPHRTFLLADGSYKYGCGAANLGFAVLIGGY